MSPTLNEQAQVLADFQAQNADRHRITQHILRGARVIDCGISAPGGLEAGLALARICLADLAEVRMIPGEAAALPLPWISVRTDYPVLACMASQYAGWQVSVGKFFAMGSGPMRAAYGKEAIIEEIGAKETPPVAVGVLESRKLPTDEVIAYISERAGLPAEKLTLLVAPAASIAGSIQVVARVLETAIHKLHTLHFDLRTLVAGSGWAPMPPPGKDEIQAIGRTNDAILYAGRVSLWVRCDDDLIQQIGPKVPSCASSDHGIPFAEIFERYNRDFYKIDPMLFSPAEVVFHNLASGRVFHFGRSDHDVLGRSCGVGA